MMKHIIFFFRITRNVLAAIKNKKFKMALELIKFRYLQPFGWAENKINYSAMQDIAPNLETDGVDALFPLSKKNVGAIHSKLVESEVLPGSFDVVVSQMKKNNEIVRDYELPRKLLNLFFTEEELTKIEKALRMNGDMKVYSNLRISIHNKDQGAADDHKWAQEFHRDFDHPSFIKIFCYLNDIEEGCGQHEYITGTHKAFSWRIGSMNRVGIEDIQRHLPDLNVVKQTGHAGTRFVANTVGYHRGTRILREDGYRTFAMFTFSKGNTTWGNEFQYQLPATKTFI